MSAGNGSYEEENEEERIAIQAVAAAVVAQKPVGYIDESYLHNAADIAASIANADLYAIAGKISEVPCCAASCIVAP